MSVAGFDVGNDTSVVALARRKGIDVVLNAESGRLTPSMVAFGAKQRFKGCIAGNNIATNPTSTINMLKRIIGRKFNDPQVQEELQNALYKFQEGPDGGILVQVNYLGEAKTYTPEQLMGMLLGELKTIAEADQGARISDCVIGIPVYFTDAERRAMLDAAAIAGLNPLRLMHECTATGLAYGIFKTELPEDKPINVAFVDVGESSFQCAIVAFKKGHMKVLAHGYDRALGGRDLDTALIAHFAEEFKAKTKLDIMTAPRARLRMKVACEKLKKILSANPEAPMNVECLMEDTDFSSSMTRDKLEEMAVKALSRVEAPLSACLADSGLTVEEISSVELVGNASRIPAVVKTVESFFKKEVCRTLNSSESVARGCALQGAMLSPAFKVREFNVEDVLPFPLQFTWKKADPETGVPTDEDHTEIIFPKNQTSVPCSKVLSLNRSAPFAMACAVADPALLPPGVSPEVGTFEMGPIAKTQDGSVPKLKVTLKVNLHGVAAVTEVQAIEEIVEPVAPAPEKPAAEAMDTDAAAANGDQPAAEGDAAAAEPQVKKKKLRTEVPVKATTAGMSSAALAAAVENEFSMALQDKVMEETKEKKNAVEEYVYSMRNKLYDSLEPYITEEERTAFCSTLEKTEDWLYDEGEDETKGVYSAKLESLQAVGNPVIQRLEEAGTRDGAAATLDTVCGVFLAQCADAKFAHIDEGEREKVAKECTEAKAWLSDKMAQQAALPKSAPLAVLTKEIAARTATVERFCKPIMSKPVPAPPPEEVKAAEPPAENGDAPMDTDAPPAAEDATPMQADLD